jgi:hypothetical protein
MELINESVINNNTISYWKGFDLKNILDHPRDGRKGIMVVFFDSIKQEEIKYNRDSIISSILFEFRHRKFGDIMDDIDNIMYYEAYNEI